MQIWLGQADFSCPQNRLAFPQMGGSFASFLSLLDEKENKIAKNCHQNDTVGMNVQPLTSILMSIGMISSACSDWNSNYPSFPIFMRFVLLWHEMPRDSGSRESHFDLLLQDWVGTTEEDRTLIALELLQPLWEPNVQSAKMLTPHRQLYLNFEGPIPGKGTVTQVLSGSVDWRLKAADELRFRLAYSRVGMAEVGEWSAVFLTAPNTWTMERISLL
jgi:hypothetical protein